MSNDFASLRTRALTTLARAALLHAQWAQRTLRRDRMSTRKKTGTHRLAKQFRELKSLLRAEELRLQRKPMRKPRRSRPSS